MAVRDLRVYADCAVWRGGIVGRRGRVVADWPRGADGGRKVNAARSGGRFDCIICCNVYWEYLLAS